MEARSLYALMIEPIFARWANGGNSDYAELVTKKAYSMLRDSSEFFDDTPFRIPAEIRSDLEEIKLIYRRAADYHFRHERVRAFLASRFIVNCWEEIFLRDKEKIGTTWVVALSFVAELLDPGDRWRFFSGLTSGPKWRRVNWD